MNVKGKDSKNFPPIANKIAKITDPKIIRILRLFDIFFGEILVRNLRIK